ncbi:MAG TPA: DegV family protein [Candidatus Binatia bacterium]|nr:DegV family protein [Candidatus Binatia bacterium]
MQLSPGAAAPAPQRLGRTTGRTAPSCALVTGSGALLGPGLGRIVATVDLPVRIGDQDLDAHSDEDLHRFYARLRGGEMAETSTSPPGAFLDAFRRAPAENVLCLTIPAGWSGMDDSARLAARMLAAEEGRERVTVIDTGTAAAGLGLITRVAAIRALRGDPFPAVLARAQSAIRDVRMFGALETLEFVSRSGRVNSLIAGISDSLRVRPVFRLSNNQTGRVSLCRTQSGVLSAMEKTCRDTPGRLWVLVFHADAAEMASRLEARLRETCDVARSEVVALDPIIGTYTGPGAVGYAALPISDDEINDEVLGAESVEPEQ